MKYFKDLFPQIKKNKIIIAVIMVGIIYRLITAVFLPTHLTTLIYSP